MATIEEDYVSFEVAKLLKEKGFDGDTASCYILEDSTHHIMSDKVVQSEYYESQDSNEHGHLIQAPTLQMAMKWLREVHKISLEITSKGYLVDNDVEWVCDIKAGHRLYFKHITNEKSFESCAETAIKYCLEKLI